MHVIPCILIGISIVVIVTIGYFLYERGRKAREVHIIVYLYKDAKKEDNLEVL